MTDFWQSTGVDALNQAEYDAIVLRVGSNIPRTRPELLFPRPKHPHEVKAIDDGSDLLLKPNLN